MKTARFVLMAAAIAVFSSCAKEMVSSETDGDVITRITACFADGDDKTVLDADLTTVLWNPQDEINVFFNSADAKFTAINTKAEPWTIFQSSTDLVFGGNVTSGQPYIVGVYPYSSDNKYDGENLTLTVPSVQPAVEGSFGRGAYPCIGRSKDTNIAFYNVCGGIRFSLSQSGVRKIVLTGNNDETLAGKVMVQFDGDGKPKVQAVVNGEKSIVLTAPDNGEFQIGKWYYISVLPVNLSQGFSFEFIKRTDESERGTRTFTSAKEIKRSVFGSIENADSSVEFKVGIVSLDVCPSAVCIAPMSSVQLSLTISPADAKYDWIKWSSSDETIATVDQNGMVAGKKDGKCIITTSSDNGKTASCEVYVSQTPVTTNDAIGTSYTTATLSGTFNVSDSESVSKSVFFLYSDTESTLEGLKTNGKQVNSTLSGSDFKTFVNSFKQIQKYYYVAAVTFSDKTYYGDVKSLTTLAFPDPVDLGLSVKWAICNVGAGAPKEYGDHYAWGEIATKDNYSWASYKWCNGSNDTLTKYGTKSLYGTVDNKTVLEAEDDVACVKLGGKWRIPTEAEWDELLENCTWEWTTMDGVSGILVTSKKEGYTEKSIFLPGAGYRDGTDLNYVGLCGYYWSSSLYKTIPYGACDLYISSDELDNGATNRFYGFSVRPVAE